MESRRFAVLALLEAPVHGLLSEWLTVRERMKVETVRDNTSRLLHQINKLFSSLGLLVSSAVVGCRGAERRLMPWPCPHVSMACLQSHPHGSVHPYFQAGVAAQRAQGTQRPIHGPEWLHSWVRSILPVEFANCSASSISETH